ncbi:alpha-(1,6)-fucosyltransferase-like [Argonauta hians]
MNSMRTWKVVATLLGFWLLIMMYMSTTVFQNTDTSHRTERQLRHAMDELDRLRKQNLELKQLATELKDIHLNPISKDVQSLRKRLEMATHQLNGLAGKQNISNRACASPTPSVTHEQLSRKVENDLVEFWYYLKSSMKRMKDLAFGNPVLIAKLEDVLSNGIQYKRTLMSHISHLGRVDGVEEWRLKESEDLADLVHRRIHYVQNPQNCKTAKKLVCDLSKGCGYGCQLHHVTYCLIMAYATRRTLILESKGWRYATKGWETVFQPVSDSCTRRHSVSVSGWHGTEKQKDVQVIELSIIDNVYPKPEFIPLAIPEDLATRIKRLHGDPAVWWVGQFVRYLVRPQPVLENDINETKRRLGFQNPIVGVHVRRTDKVGTEAAYHSLEEYMTHVEDYYKQLEMTNGQPVLTRRVYLASDDPNVLADAVQKYPDYHFVYDTENSKTAGLGTRYSTASLRGIIMDIHFLSLCDYLVCTFSSQVCRVAYELMQTYHGDASRRFYSLDDIYYFGGQNAHNVRAVQRHVAQRREEISFEVGDLIAIAGNHWDGYSKGFHKKTSKSGLFPSYKTTNQVVTVKFPHYPEVPLIRRTAAEKTPT